MPLADPHVTREAACLGRSAVAACRPAPWLPGTGVLLPAWRRLAQLLALMNHQVLKLPSYPSILLSALTAAVHDAQTAL